MKTKKSLLVPFEFVLLAIAPIDRDSIQLGLRREQTLLFFTIVLYDTLFGVSALDTMNVV
jgi:hypothetical protein